MMRRALASTAVLLAIGVVHCKPSSSTGPTPSASATVVASSTASAPETADASAFPVLPKHTGPKKPHAPGETSVAIAGSEPGTDDAAVPAESPKSVGLPEVSFGEAGPLVLRGYPTPLRLGMRDYATVVAYAKDGSEVLACGRMTPLGEAKGAEQVDTCFVGKRGGVTARVGVEEGPKGAFVGAAFAERLALLKDGTRIILHLDEPAGTLAPPPLNTTWPYAKDLVLAVAKLETGGAGTSLRVGGSVAGQEPVYPITLAVRAKVPDVPFDGDWNAILASPDNTELAFIGHFACMEWCNDIVITRLGYGKLASLVFNDSGFRLHQKKDFAGSRDLFLKATWADPRAALPPYNLACAYALTKDEANAAKALKLAIAVGGTKVKARAKKDPDFKGVLAAAWFRGLTD
jgi:hypothetical protein